jgi:hypothetical protein
MTHREPEPPSPRRRLRRDVSPTIVALTALAMATAGLLIELRRVDLVTGTDTLYLGLAIAAGGAVLAIGVHARTWLRLFTVGVTALCVVNVVQTSHELDKQRDQVKQRLDQVKSDLVDELPRN